MTILQRLQESVNRALRPLDVSVNRVSVIRRLQMDANAIARQSPSDLNFLRELRDPETLRLLDLLPYSSSQIRQDLFVVSTLGFKERGYFVEFGAADGVKTSNTYLLERFFGWTGLLLEPARVWHGELAGARKCVIDRRCVWSESGASLTFVERELAGTSSVQAPGGEDSTTGSGTGSNNDVLYEVSTVSLLDALREHRAPDRIDYLSIDTEGSELRILSAFDFDAYRFSVITCEHNFGPDRDALQSLLSANGYRRVHEGLSQFDDWYVDEHLGLE